MDKEKILSLLSEHLEIVSEQLEAYSYESPLMDLGLTSLKLISFIVELEELFGIEIYDSDLLFENFSTLEKTFDTLKKYFVKDISIKKCLVLDADNVLWKGISGEEDIVIDNQVLDFQNALLDLYHRGVLLCVCSKNEEFLVDRSFLENEMPLNKEHFVCFIANKSDKVTNICAIAENLNLSLDSMVFVDDSDYEMGFVSVNLPEVECIKFDYSDMSVAKRITELFEGVQMTSDLNRTKLYSEQKFREKEKLKFTSVEEYNASLLTQAVVSRARQKDCARLAELSVRTHQFNLSAKIYTEDQISEMLTSSEYEVLSLDAEDKYGKMGIVGMAVLKEGIIEAFMLSCRVFDRGFEFVLLDALKKASSKTLSGVYVATDKNKRYSRFYTDNGVNTI